MFFYHLQDYDYLHQNYTEYERMKKQLEVSEKYASDMLNENIRVSEESHIMVSQGSSIKLAVNSSFSECKISFHKRHTVRGLFSIYKERKNSENSWQY